MDKEYIKKQIKKAIISVQKKGKLPNFIIKSILVGPSQDMRHGDYSTNIALLISKKAGKSPIEIAKIIATELEKGIAKAKISKTEAMNPGFINFWLSREELFISLEKILQEKDRFGSDRQGKTMIIDYSAPNIAKSFGVGHLRSTIIGQSIYNIYKFLGWECIGDNHLGDWGTQFGKLIVAIKKWSKKDLENLTIQDLENLYVKFHQEAKQDSSLLEEARENFKKLEQGDKEIKKIWKSCVDISLKEYDKVYKLLGVRIDYALGESFYDGKTQEMIQEIKKKGLAKESQGALVLFLPGFDIPLMLLKSDGATTYETRELATIKYRVDKWNPDLIIYEVGADQTLHFQKSFSAAKMLGYGQRARFVHIAHGLIRWPHGKFSTRKGDTIHLEEILKQSIQKANEIIETSKSSKSLSIEAKAKIAKEVGIGAIKYNDLSRHYSKDIIFNWKRILSLNGNSGPYLQYVVVRCQSVLDKDKINTRKEISKLKIKNGIINLNLEEETLLRTLREFPEVVKKAGSDFSPNLICSFAFNLAQRYNIFYEKCPILDAKTEDERILRLALTRATRQILKNSLDLLGISIPQKM